MCMMCGCSGHDHQGHQDEHYSREVPRAAAGTKPCPQCSYPIQDDFILCPLCGTQLKTSCPECHKAVDVTWSRCPYCGAALKVAATHPNH